MEARIFTLLKSAFARMTRFFLNRPFGHIEKNFLENGANLRKSRIQRKLERPIFRQIFFSELFSKKMKSSED